MFDLTEVKPHEFVQYGLACLETVAAEGDECAKECRARLRIMVSTHSISISHDFFTFLAIRM